MNRMVLGVFLLTAALLAPCSSISNATLLEPLVSVPGDYIVVGIFDIGSLKTDYVTGIDYCGVNTQIYSIEKALVFQDRMKNFTESGGKSIGYEIYSGCGVRYLTQQISSKVALNPKVIGFLASDYKDRVQPSIGAPTSYFIPTLTYVYSEEAYLEQEHYPTYLSLIETEEMEAMSMINLLKFLNVPYVDVWYNELSKVVAEKVYNEHVIMTGCGRKTLYNGLHQNVVKGEVDEAAFKKYNESYQVPPAPVQILLFNGNKYQVIPFLKHTINKLRWRNVTYILGYTVSRDKYRTSQKEVLAKAKDVENETLIYLRSDIQNYNLTQLREPGNLLYEKAKSGNDMISVIYQQSRNCSMSTGVVVCTNKRQLTSWLGYVATATELIKRNVDRVLLGKTGEKDIDIYELRKAVFESMRNNTDTIEIYGTSVENIGFENSTVAMGYQVEEYRHNITMNHAIIRGRVSFENASNVTLEWVLREHVHEIGGAEPCSVDCPAGSHIVLMSYAHGLSCCWNCQMCPANTISTKNNSPTCTACKKREFSPYNGTECKDVPIKFISVSSPIFHIGLVLVSISVVSILGTAIYIYSHRNRPVIRASDPVFCYLFLTSLLLGDLLTAVTLLKPTSLSCQQEFYLCTVFVGCVNVNLLFRSLKIYKVFMAAMNFEITRPLIFKFLTRGAQFGILATSIGITVMLTVLSIFLQGWTYQEIQSGPHENVYLLCTSENFLATCYPFLLSSLQFLATLVLAYKMRSFPHNFKETTTIFTTSFIIIMSSLMFLTGYTMAEPSIKSLLRAIVYFSITNAFFICLFLPKLLILVKKEDVREDLSAALQSFCSQKEERRT